MQLNDGLKAIYFLECQGNIKIGVANNIRKRIQQTQGASPHPVALVQQWCVPADKAFAVEAMLHRALKPKRVRGEWFKVTMEDIEKFEEVAFKLSMGDTTIDPEAFNDPADKKLAAILAQRRWPRMNENLA